MLRKNERLNWLYSWLGKREEGFEIEIGKLRKEVRLWQLNQG